MLWPVLVLAFAGCLFGFAPWLLRNAHGGPERQHAINNLRQLAKLLSDFDARFGRYPDSNTIGPVREATRTHLTLDDSSSNMLFRQLLIAGAKIETPFWAPGVAPFRAPDNMCDNDLNALCPGECSFAYVTGLNSRSPINAPLVVTPLRRGSTLFDRAPFKGWSLILFNDGAVELRSIDGSGRVLINGMDIFDPRQPFWKGKAPQIRWQE